MKIPRIDPAKFLFVASAFLICFGYGVAVGLYQIFPFPAIEFAASSVAQVFEEREAILEGRPIWWLEPARYEGDGVTRFEPDLASPGLTFLLGLFDNAIAIRLIRLDGSIVRTWPVRFHEIFPDTSHIQPQGLVPQADWNAGIHGMRAFPDGSLLFNFEGLGSVKMDRCGVVQWTIPRMTHHAVDVSRDGGFWIPSTRFITGSSPFPALTPPYDEETVIKVSPDGRVLQEISVLGLFFENHLEYLLFANGFEGLAVPRKRNLLHLNDVEELKPGMAEHFPEFAAGDLLLSLRDYNLLMVVDPATRKVKWHQTGPWIKQHDPDFSATGTISVFSNNPDGTDTGSLLGGSTIVEVEPLTHETTVLYGNRPGQRLFTEIRGKHQRLANGNLLITESQAGRVFEITDSGEIVWEFINRYDSDEIADVTGARRYPEEYFAVHDWTCP